MLWLQAGQSVWGMNFLLCCYIRTDSEALSCLKVQGILSLWVKCPAFSTNVKNVQHITTIHCMCLHGIVIKNKKYAQKLGRRTLRRNKLKKSTVNMVMNCNNFVMSLMILSCSTLTFCNSKKEC
jgi:hypothetical protein